jgi:hypothetical protein
MPHATHAADDQHIAPSTPGTGQTEKLTPRSRAGRPEDILSHALSCRVMPQNSSATHGQKRHRWWKSCPGAPDGALRWGFCS